MELADTLKGESHPVIKAKCFDYILENNGSESDFQKKCLAFFQKLLTIKEKI